MNTFVDRHPTWRRRGEPGCLSLLLLGAVLSQMPVLSTCIQLCPAPHLSSVPKLLPCCYCRLHFSLKNSFAFGYDFLSTRCFRAHLSESAVPQGELSAVPGASYQWLFPHKAEPSWLSKHISRYEERKEIAPSGMLSSGAHAPNQCEFNTFAFKAQKVQGRLPMCVSVTFRMR